jgi:hypothetical protein
VGPQARLSVHSNNEPKPIMDEQRVSLNAGKSEAEDIVLDDDEAPENSGDQSKPAAPLEPPVSAEEKQKQVAA